MAKKQIVILGGGTGGTMTANRLRRRFDADEAEIHVVDRDDRHVYQPGLLFVPFGLAHARRDRAAAPTPAARRHRLPRERGRIGLDRARRGAARRRRPCFRYDVLVVASGVRAAARGDRGHDRPRLERARLHLLRPRRAPTALRERAASASTAAGSS